MNELIQQLLDELRSTWRFRWLALVVAGLVSVALWLVVFSLPDTYTAEARMFVNTRTTLRSGLEGLAIERDAAAVLNKARQSLLADQQLQRIAQETGILANSVTNQKVIEDVIADMKSRISFTDVSASDREEERATAGRIYTMSYRDESRERALMVVTAMLDLLKAETLGGGQEGSATTREFLQARIEEYKRRLDESDEKLAEFKRRNVGLLPTEAGGYFAMLQTEKDAVKKAESDLSIAQQRRAEYEKQLRGIVAVTSTAVSPGAVPGSGNNTGGTDTLSLMRDAQARLDELLLRFTEKHPEVIAARANIEALKQRRTAEIARIRSGDADAVAASGISSNPVYQSTLLALNNIDVEIAALRGQLYRHRSNVESLQRNAETAPFVEAEYAQLTRDNELNKKNYNALKESFEKNRIGEQADNTGPVEFKTVQPPTAELAPTFPPRLLFLVGALLLGVLAGAAVAYLMRLLQPVVTSVRDLTELTGLRVIGVVGAAFPGQIRARNRADARRLGLAAAALVAALVLVLVLNWAGVRLQLAPQGPA